MIKNSKGITLVSLVITIALMLIISSITISVSVDRFEINDYNKMINDLRLLEDKVSNYYLKYKAIPIVRDEENNPILYDYTEIPFNTNRNDNEFYYILDLSAMEGISLNYGESGYKNINSSDDVYIINEKSHQIYYVRGVELKDNIYHTIVDNEVISDNIPPSRPEIKIISGDLNEDGIYESTVKVEIIPGKDAGRIASKTEFSIDNGNNWTDISTLNNNMYILSKEGTYTLEVRSYDNNENISSNTLENITIEFISVPEAKLQNLIFEKETRLTDDFGNRIVVPMGFKIAADSGTNIKEGIVIEDTKYENTLGSQFVWVPCGEVYVDTALSTVDIPIGRYSFDESGLENVRDNTFVEDTTDSHDASKYANKIAYNINEFLKSVKENGGYYFGRYEAGIENGELDLTEFTNNTAPNANWSGYTIGSLVSKDNTTVWNYITQNKASELSRNMYKDVVDIRSDLVNSYAWDTAILYIQRMGNTGYSRTRIKSAIDEVCKINDMAGEKYEWTTETSLAASNKACTKRGGSSDYSGSYTAGYYSYSEVEAFANTSYRVILYIK